jgi:uncharacterized coiled-coil protein SlyX
MKSHDLAAPDALAERITKLEELFTHLQRTVLDLNEVLIKHGQRVDAAEARLAQLASAVAERTAEPARPFDPEAERPPHY